jgi:hypothetical protein
MIEDVEAVIGGSKEWPVPDSTGGVFAPANTQEVKKQRLS